MKSRFVLSFTLESTATEERSPQKPLTPKTIIDMMSLANVRREEAARDARPSFLQLLLALVKTENERNLKRTRRAPPPLGTMRWNETKRDIHRRSSLSLMTQRQFHVRSPLQKSIGTISDQELSRFVTVLLRCRPSRYGRVDTEFFPPLTSTTIIFWKPCLYERLLFIHRRRRTPNCSCPLSFVTNWTSASPTRPPAQVAEDNIGDRRFLTLQTATRIGAKRPLGSS